MRRRETAEVAGVAVMAVICYAALWLALRGFLDTVNGAF